jgi:hypothetical protein
LSFVVLVVRVRENSDGMGAYQSRKYV